MLRLLDRKASLYFVLSVAAGDAEQLATPELLEAVQQLPEPFREKCRSFWQIFQQLRTDSTTLPLEELIREIYDTTDFLSVMQLYQDGEKKRANLNLLIQYARQYEAQGQAAFTGGVTGVSENHAPFQGTGISVCIFGRTGNRVFQTGQLQKNARFRYGKNGAVFIRCKELSKVSDLILFGIAEREKTAAITRRNAVAVCGNDPS